MTIDLTQFHDAFYEESLEALGQMEAALLGLAAGSVDAARINTIFRVAHSIKGGAATFGFDQISSFTHTLETLLDELRSQRLMVTAALQDLLLRSVDLMREMLHARQADRPIDAQRVADLQFDLEMIVARRGAAPTSPAPNAAAAVQALVAPVVAPVAAPAGEPARGTCYQISFRPFLHLMARGNDPLRMFHELRELGDLRVNADISALPALEQFDPENCYLSWSLTLRTEAPRQSIIEAFDWAEEDCQLDVSVLEDAAAPGALAARAVRAAAIDGSRARPAVAGDSAGASGVSKGVDGASIRVSIQKVEDLMNSVGELLITQSMLGQFDHLLEGIDGERMRAGLAQLERNVRALQESVMRVRMVPISFLFSRFPRMVRDLGQRLGKQVELRISGGDTELDKTVLEKISDPLTHLIRNCIDHGIEEHQQRLASGKDPCGTVRLHAYHRGSSIIVEVSDDGAGLQRERILAKARLQGLVGADENLADAAIDHLIFVPGFSTQDQANDISGRGVGMDVVRRNVDELGGVIEVRSEAGKGSRFIITLPLTLAIVDGQTVAVGDESYIVPLTAIVESLQLSDVSVNQVVGHGELVSFRGECLPMLRLQRMFKARCERPRDPRDALIMVVEGEGRRVALCVDELLGQQQVVVKTLESNYGHIDGIAGATILGDGSVTLILDVAGLTRSVPQSLAA
jgi:two-component system chemotaxis sensor kinase CheA